VTRRRVAAIDCGTNSIRLLVAEWDAAGALVTVERLTRIVRLGAGVDRTGVFAPEALRRTLDAVTDYARRIDQLGADQVRMVATSASRDVANRDEFIGGVRSRLGVEPDVVSGDDEARLSFAGATHGLGERLPGPYLVLDVGGGSTELVLGTAVVDAAQSVDIGGVRLTERHLRSDPPSSSEVDAAVGDIDAALDGLIAVPLATAASVIGVAGTVTTVGAMHAGLATYDPAKVHHHRVPAGDLADIAETLIAMPVAERAAIPVMQPGREDVIAAGALIVARILDRCGADELIVSERDILDGIALSLSE
jgi:exopolyphosphatase / guanosine-5'-triphosphate,3'-diphosphate pyrophosphatase